jgi:hypothetical protein
MTVGQTENNTEIQLYGSNLSCNPTMNMVPRFSPNLTQIESVSRFTSVSLAFSSDTSTVVVCGGFQTASKVTFLIT